MERAELETTITYDMEEQVVRIFSAIRRDQGKLKKVGITPISGTANRGFNYKVPLSRLRWRVVGTTPSRRGFGSSKSPRTVQSTDRKGIPDGQH